MAISAPTFRGFDPAAIEFLAELAANNDRAWFQPRKADYERLVKEPLEALVAELAERLDARGIPLHADPKRSIFRIYRDTRFSKDKSPYKTHLGASFPWMEPGDGRARGGRPAGARATAGTSTSSRARCTSAAGMWMPDKARLERVPTGGHRGARPGPGRPRGAGVRGRVRIGHRARDVQAAAAGRAGRPPDGRPVPLQGRRVRPPPGRRRGHVPSPARHARRCVRGRHARASGSWPRSGRDAPPAVRGGLLDQPARLADAARRVPRGRARPAGTASGSTTTCSPTRATRPTRSWRAGRRSPRSPSLTRRVRLGLLVAANTFRNPGRHGEAGDDARSPLRRPGRARHRRRLVRRRARRVRDRLRVRVRRATRPARRGGRAHPAAARRRAGRRTRVASTRCTTRSARRGRSRTRLPILIGGSGPTKTLRTTARDADLWNGFGTPERIAATSEILRERCAEIGRPFEAIERTVTIHAVVRDTTAEAEAVWAETARTERADGRRRLRRQRPWPDDRRRPGDRRRVPRRLRPDRRRRRSSSCSGTPSTSRPSSGSARSGPPRRHGRVSLRPVAHGVPPSGNSPRIPSVGAHSHDGR